MAFIKNPALQANYKLNLSITESFFKTIISERQNPDLGLQFIESALEKLGNFPNLRDLTKKIHENFYNENEALTNELLERLRTVQFTSELDRFSKSFASLSDFSESLNIKIQIYKGDELEEIDCSRYYNPIVLYIRERNDLNFEVIRFELLPYQEPKRPCVVNKLTDLVNEILKKRYIIKDMSPNWLFEFNKKFAYLKNRYQLDLDYSDDEYEYVGENKLDVSESFLKAIEIDRLETQSIKEILDEVFADL